MVGAIVSSVSSVSDGLSDIISGYIATMSRPCPWPCVPLITPNFYKIIRIQKLDNQDYCASIKIGQTCVQSQSAILTEDLDPLQPISSLNLYPYVPTSHTLHSKGPQKFYKIYQWNIQPSTCSSENFNLGAANLNWRSYITTSCNGIW